MNFAFSRIARFQEFVKNRKGKYRLRGCLYEPYIRASLIAVGLVFTACLHEKNQPSR